MIDPETVSVVIATIPPRARLLERALASVAAQTRQPDDLIVQLDEIGVGAGPTRNAGFERAWTDYIAVLDDDDELLPHHLEFLMAAAEATHADVIYPWFELVEDGQVIVDRELATMFHGVLIHPLGVPFGAEQAAHMRQYAFIPACLLLRRHMALSMGGYPPPDHPDYEAHGGCEDWALLVRMLDAGARFCHVPARTWRLHKATATAPTTAGRPWR